MPIPDVVRSMVDASVDAVAVVDLELRVLHFNAAYVQLTGLRTRVLRRGEAQGVCHEHLGLQTCDDGCLARRALELGHAIRLDEVGSHSRDLRLIAVATPLVDEAGEVYAVVESYRDVTAESRVQTAYRKLLEKERADKLRLAEDAAQQLGARNEQLREANRQLERASSAKSRFLASVSHEIRTPLAGVIGVAQLLVNTSLDDTQRQLVHTLVDSGDALLALINNILDLSKIEAEKLELEHVPFSLRAVVDGSATLFAPDAEKRGIELVVCVESDVHDAFRGDPGRLRQCLVNLTSNAVKFTTDGYVYVHVSMDDDVPDNIRLSVTDSGIGIPLDRQRKLFEPFTQADESTTRRFGGTGLGLTITREIAALMEGSVGVESTPGQGSTFWLTLPLEPMSSTRSDAVDPARASLHVEVVEAHALHRHALVQALAGQGVQASGYECVSHLPVHRSDEPRIVFVGMPMRADELEALKVLQAHGPHTIIPVSSLSDHADALDVIGEHAASMTRPIRHGQTSDVLDQLIQGPADITPRVPEADLPRARAEHVVLIVEDSPVNQLILQSALNDAGYRHVTTSHGLQAVQACEEASFDLILIDCQMPVMDGFEATRRIRKLERVRGVRTPIIALTANATEADRRACFAAGMDDFMTKPYKLDMLVAELDRRLLDLDLQAAS